MPSPMTIPFLPARAKLWIGSIDDPKIEVRAQYNPKELQLDKQVPWGEHKAKLDKSGSKKSKPEDRSQQGDLEFTGAPKRTMTLELLFDCYEHLDPDESVEPDIRALEELSSAWKPESTKQEERRPHHCIVVWGSSESGMRPFRCVIESLSTKYTMWNHGGIPKRATCTLKLKEAYEMTPSVGLQATDPALKAAKYGEKRRPPMWDREKPTAYDQEAGEDREESIKKYDEKMEELLTAPPKKATPPEAGAAPALTPAPASASPGPPGRGR